MPDPRTLIGKLLLKAKKKPTQTVTPPPSMVTPPPSNTGLEAESKLTKGKQAIEEAINQAQLAVAKLPFDALKTPLEEKLALLQKQIDTLDDLADIPAKAHRLMQVKEACNAIQTTDVSEAKRKGEEASTAIDNLTLSLTTASNGLTDLTVKATHGRMEGKVKALQGEVEKIKSAGASADLNQPAVLQKQIDSLVKEIETTTEQMKEALAFQKNLATTPLGTFTNALKGKLPAVRGGLAPDLDVAKQWGAEVQSLVDKEAWDKVEAQAKRVEQACIDMTTRMNELQTLETMPNGIAKTKAKLQNALARARQTNDKLSKHKDFTTAFEGLHGTLDKHIKYNTWLVSVGNPEPTDPVPTELAKKRTTYDNNLKKYLDLMVPEERKARRSFDAYLQYDETRQEVIGLIDELTKHAHHDTIKADVAQASKIKDDAHTNGTTQGWHCSRVALLPLFDRCADIKTLANQVQAKEMFLPNITKRVNGKGLDAKYAQVALKILVEENCSLEEAVEMAEIASGYEKTDGLSEVDATHSARVKQSLLASDKNLTKERAHAIGKVVRCRGSATSDDIKAVASDMKRMPEGAVKAFSDNNIETIICRGPVTNARPDLHDVVPRGWGLDQTWDAVPGLGGAKALMVGTMDDGAGGRKVPGPSEGPCPHGTPDLLGHEAGHTFDTMNGGAKRNDVVFLAARTKDVEWGQTGDANGMMPIRDNYFMSTKETEQKFDLSANALVNVPEGKRSKQSQDAAHSETFAESFALHCQKNTTKWPELMTFWGSYSW